MVRGAKHRRSIRLRGYDYSQPGAYFVTICTQNRLSVFGRIADGKMILDEPGAIANSEWKKLDQRFPQIELDEYIIMPNHIHGIIIITDTVGAIHELPIHPSDIENGLQPDVTEENSPAIRRRMTLPRVIGFYKMNSAKAINIALKTPGKHRWQRNYYEHIIRNNDSLNRIRRYIHENPSQWSNDSENPNHANR